MAPPSATNTHTPVNTGAAFHTTSHSEVSAITHEPGFSKEQAQARAPGMKLPSRTPFEDRYEERDYQKGRLALAFRIFAKLGYAEGVAGHITLRDPVEPTCFWVNPFGVAWPLLRASDLILVNKEGEVVEGGPCRLLNTAAYMIHHAVHTARPEINAVAHSHSIYGRAFCSLGRPLETITQDACAFHSDLALYSSFRGVVLASDEGEAIASALGSKKAALLQNHGLLTCGETIESAVFWFTSLEKCCHAQLLADAAAGGRGVETIKIADEDAAYTYETVGTEKAGHFSCKPAFDMMEHESGTDYKW
ncbi:class II Aldolase and Adducin domain-containing protein [Sclerotinia borealis F-4128]|uniref:Class II Aldolase and Adducin domain-containing protein n=1 Tax=Sclerotinia borealis (strain F-4128) TaxID=1432307 RepID=W9C967_SCLBF|nr:class II Aldolase and Adducin domain-containing protein [Sclerotinia borealis F-4128]